MKKIIYFILILFLLVIIFFIFFNVKSSGKTFAKIPYLTINDAKVNLMIADDSKEQILGLSYQKSLEKNSGMLFIFDDKQVRSFWMKDMNFPLDIIWINDNKIVSIDKSLPPAGERPQMSYSSKLPINYALEVNGGFCESNNIKVGDEIKYFLQ